MIDEKKRRKDGAFLVLAALFHAARIASGNETQGTESVAFVNAQWFLDEAERRGIDLDTVFE